MTSHPSHLTPPPRSTPASITVTIAPLTDEYVGDGAEDESTQPEHDARENQGPQVRRRAGARRPGPQQLAVDDDARWPGVAGAAAGRAIGRVRRRMLVARRRTGRRHGRGRRSGDPKQHRRLLNTRRHLVASLPALRPRAPPAERGPSLESIYRVSLTVDLCEGNKIISLKKFISPQPVGGPSKRKKSGGPGHVPCVPIG